MIRRVLHARALPLRPHAPLLHPRVDASRALRAHPPRAFSSDPHAPLREQDVTSKAMLKKVRQASPPPAVLRPPPPPPAPHAPPPPQDGPQPSVGAWFVGNMVQGFGITLGFVLVLSVFRAVGLMEGRREEREGPTKRGGVIAT